MAYGPCEWCRQCYSGSETPSWLLACTCMRVSCPKWVDAYYVVCVCEDGKVMGVATTARYCGVATCGLLNICGAWIMRARHATGSHVAKLVRFFCFLQMFGADEGSVV